ncbi:aminoglycoside phosphotransferase family protein [Jannaschia sp. S6380]|uniref:phosphotransferase family protein n=1 Tax=Jannaschia sp. S6380 TaxID=2926408 RepID=UPI001FF551ED|nr:aminoglycoside phosphotransferase family protein [Jannaschia sp. S6380]MCK0168063.1 aminoglycoside phosphotransferase family protein [Jannaschia sp. S6380]
MLRHSELEAGARAAWRCLAPRLGEAPEAREVSVLRARVSRGQARIVCVLRRSGQADLILKHAPGETPARFAGQVDAHARAERLFAAAQGLGVPTLHAADPEVRAMVMARVPGMTAHDAMLLAPDGSERLEILRACGRWAGHLHRAGDVRFTPLRPAGMLRKVGRWRDAVADGSLPVPAPAKFLDLADRTLRRAEDDRGRKSTLTVAHGDLSLRNLMIGPDGQASGIDFGTTEMRAPSRDLARLLIGHATFFGPAGGEDADGLVPARAALLDAHGGRWRDRAGLDLAMMADLLLIWQSIPVAPWRRGLVHHRRWRGIRRMAARFRAAS